MIIKVTNDHIAEGEQGDENSCAVALAVKEQVPGVLPETVRVQGCSILFTAGDVAYDIRTPDTVGDWIDNFDAGGLEVGVLDEEGEHVLDEDGWCLYERTPVQPIEFELNFNTSTP